MKIILRSDLDGLGKRGVPTVAAFVNRVPEGDWAALEAAAVDCWRR